MRRIHSKDTSPEIAVRMILRRLGFLGYRLHRKDLPGRPDIAFINKRKAIMIHGCFWHGHDCKTGLREPKSNRDYWLPKIQRTRERDIQHHAALNELGWAMLTIWECELKDMETLTAKLLSFMEST